MVEPRRIWWARPRKLCALERPGGGGRSHRRDRREAEIEWLRARGVRMVLSTMRTGHNLADYERAGFEWCHAPVVGEARSVDDLAHVLEVLGEELRRPGAVAVHGDRKVDVPIALCAAHLGEWRGIDPRVALERAAKAGLEAAPAARILGVG